MKVLTIAHHPGVFITEIVKHLRYNGIKVKYLAPYKSEFISLEELSQLGIEYIPLKVSGTMAEPGILQKKDFIKSPKLEMFLYAFHSLEQIFKEARNVDIIHAHWVLPMGFLSGIVGKILGKPVVVTVHGASVYLKPNIGFDVPTYPYMRLLLRITFLITQRLIAVSQDCKNQLINRKAPKNKIRLVYNGVDHKRFHPEINGKEVRRKLNLINNPLILTVRRLEIRKGVQFLIKAMKRVKEEVPEAKLLIIGDGSYEEYLKELTKDLDLENEILFLGRIPNWEIPSYFAACDIFVIPSLEESFGITALEAMAIKKPVIGTSVGGLKEVVDNNCGIVIPPANVDELAEGLLRLLKSKKDRIRLGLNGREKVEKIFNWERAAQEYIKIFKELI